MLAEKLENIAERARMLSGQVSPTTWQALRRVPGQMATASTVAHHLEAGRSCTVKLSLLLVEVITPLRALGGFVDHASYERIHPLISDLEDYIPLAETLDAGFPLVFSPGQPHAPKPAA
jgi:hypothetical protein